MKQYYYIALTIGPIYKTLAFAKKTRELWAASYIFSHLMEKIVEIVNQKKTYEIILPIKFISIEPQNKDVGLFPDRLILRIKKTNDSKQEVLLKEFNDVISAVSNEIQITAGFSMQNNYFDNYFQLYSLIVLLNEEVDPIKTIYPLLDSMEQQSSFNSQFTDNQIKLFLNNVRGSSLYINAFQNRKRFLSVPEIATQNLKFQPNYDRIFEECSDNDEIDPYSLLNKEYNCTGQEPILYNYHKYMAVVQADGDDMGKLLRALFEYGGTDVIKSFSECLMRFGNTAASKIKKFNGVPIYLGGDDMLFFAPVKNEDTIFELIVILDNLFREYISENPLVIEAITLWNKGTEFDRCRKLISLPTISFGCAFSYHKYPLKEAIETARSLLFDNAKHFPGKNTISFRLLKHSGHYIGASINKYWQLWDDFRYMLNDEELNKISLNSMQYNLEPLRPVFKRILCGRLINLETANIKEITTKFLPAEGFREFFLKNLSANFFNDKTFHEFSREFINYVLALLLQTYRDMEDSFGNNTHTADRAIDSVYTFLRIMQFYNQPFNKED